MNESQAQYLTAAYDHAFSGIFPQRWIDRLRKDNLSPSDLVFIGGKPASQVFAQAGAKAKNPEQYASIMKQQIALAALSSSARIDYVRSATSAYGDLHFSDPESMGANVQAREKRPNF